VAAGADFIQTQLIYDIPRFKEFMQRVVDMGLHEKVAILAGVGPLKSTGMAKYMRDSVPGMLVEDQYIDRMTAAIAGIEPLKGLNNRAKALKAQLQGLDEEDSASQAQRAELEAELAELNGRIKEIKATRTKAWQEEGIKICIEQIQELREIEGVAGIHLMAIEWEAAVKPIVEGAGLLPRPDFSSSNGSGQSNGG
jgi:methylenetetrahydrofolate reductase (NADPH)